MRCTHCDGSGVEPERFKLVLSARVGFDEFWVLYDRTGPRKKAKECWDAALRRGHSPETILAGLVEWVAYWRMPGAASMKWPQGWLNSDYFLDAPPAVRVEVTRKAMPGRSGIEAALARGQQRQIESTNPKENR